MFRKGNAQAELVLAAGAALGEGPVWDARDGTLVWVDIDRGQVHRFDPCGGPATTVELGRPVGVAVPRAAGGLALGIDGGFAVLDDGAPEPRLIAELPGAGVAVRMNDGCCDSAGRFWAGTIGLDAEPGAGALYRLDPDHRLHTMLDGVTNSNGLDWSPDDASMYYVDSGTGRVDVFDFDAARGTIANRRAFVAIADDEGEPDGLTVDADGHVWVAIWGAGVVRRYSPDGTPAGQVALPVSLVTSCAFGGEDLAELYITTARYDLTDQELARQPEAGGVFRARPGVAGRPVRCFNG